MAKRGPEELVIEAAQQLQEHKDWLKIQIRKTMPEATALLDLVDDIKLAVVKQEEFVKDLAGQSTISIAYEYPDELYAFLEDEETPVSLRVAITGGVEV